jgi:hypothetical protein
MTFDSKTDRYSPSATAEWMPKLRRPDEGDRWQNSSLGAPEPRDEETIFPPISPPPVWPRVFPSL